MDGWMDGWMDKWTDGLMPWMNKKWVVAGWMNGLMD